MPDLCPGGGHAWALVAGVHHDAPAWPASAVSCPSLTPREPAMQAYVSRPKPGTFVKAQAWDGSQESADAARVAG